MKVINVNKLYLYTFLGLLWCNVSFANNHLINIKCDDSYDIFEYFFKIDLESKMLGYDTQMPSKLNWSIIEVTDDLIRATRPYRNQSWSDGAVFKKDVYLTIDRVNGIVQKSYKVVEDTRVEGTEYPNNNFLSDFFTLKNCKPFKGEAKF